VALETGTTAFFVARQLSAGGLAPIVVDAHEVRVKAHRPTQKSERRDARELCEGLRQGIYRVIVHVPSAQVASLRDTLSRRRHFVRVQAAEINAAKRLLRAAGLARASRQSTQRTRLGYGVAVGGRAGNPSGAHSLHCHLGRSRSRMDGW
jgi:transposase